MPDKMFAQQSLKKAICFFCFSLLFIFMSITGRAQSLGDPIINITFGAGTAVHAGPLPPDVGSTTYTYSSGTPNDGFYSIVNTSAGMHSTWWTTTDHTGDPGGYMMIANASYDPGIFYTRKVNALCGTTQYQFSAWVKNLVNDNELKPNITFSIETADGQPIPNGSKATGDIQIKDQWVQYVFNFTTPSNTDALVLKMTNNAPGGLGNDVAIDDITFRPYGAPVAVTFDQPGGTQTFCEGTTHTININTTTSLVSGYTQKLQTQTNGVWTDLTPAGTNGNFNITTSSIPGTYSYRVVSALAGNISSTNCVVASNPLTVVITPLPVASFDAIFSPCFNGDAVVFKDTSTPAGSVTYWAWDFGDGTQSTLQNPSHVYTQAGDHTVTLTVNNGCTSLPVQKLIHTFAAPAADFDYTKPNCVTQAITITDKSTSGEGAITSWLWDYGDGSPAENKTTNAAFAHTFAATGTYPVTLVITNANGCTARMLHNVTISPLPDVNFAVPDVCLFDTNAQFTDASTIGDNSVLKYLWDFGDSANSPGNNTSTDKNPTHSYHATGVYTITLTVITDNNCQVTKTKQMTVNGAVPKAGLTPLNPPYCSNREVVFQNNSTVDFGNITRVKIYFDYGGDQSKFVDDSSPYPGKVYRHLYPTFQSPATKVYQIYMIAYSGASCNSTLQTNITLQAAPTLTFTELTSVCHDGGTVELNVTPLGGVFSGSGVSSSGVFDPLVSGTGTFPVQYIYTANNACADTITRNITVIPSPVLTMGAATTILEGGNAKLQATSTGDNLTYLWSPATGLSSTHVANPVASPTANITYTLTVTNGDGCQASGQIAVTVLKAPVIPNAFTPNGDGNNDTWDIKYLDSYPGCTVDIFNRSGQKVYNSTGYGIAWDGRYNGVSLPIGTYFYIIDPKHGRDPISGSVTILR